MVKTLHGVVAACGFAAVLTIAAPASADPYKWCAVYRAGGQNCGFLTIEQCQATISGVGGFCQPNQFYTGPDRSSSGSTRVSRAKPTEVSRKPAEKTAPTRRAPQDRGNEDRFQ